MDRYDSVAYKAAKRLTLDYSTSFGISSRLFDAAMQPHIYAIYGLVRIADEIVDTYRGSDAAEQLNDLENETYAAIKRGFSTNIIIHAYAKTARTFSIDRSLIHPFFESMRMDLSPENYTSKKYKAYIYGSAEVVGLMCLRVFCNGNNDTYDHLKAGAVALGAAYQKVNFLRDFAADYNELKRVYFPGVTFEDFSEAQKQQIAADIRHDFSVALPSLKRLPKGARAAITTSYAYYAELLAMLENTPVEVIKKRRISVPPSKKVRLLTKTALKERFGS